MGSGGIRGTFVPTSEYENAAYTICLLFFGTDSIVIETAKKVFHETDLRMYATGSDWRKASHKLLASYCELLDPVVFIRSLCIAELPMYSDLVSPCIMDEICGALARNHPHRALEYAFAEIGEPYPYADIE